MQVLQNLEPRWGATNQTVPPLSGLVDDGYRNRGFQPRHRLYRPFGSQSRNFELSVAGSGFTRLLFAIGGMLEHRSYQSGPAGLVTGS